MDTRQTLALLSKMSSQEASAFVDGIRATARNDLVKTEWHVTYDPSGQDMISFAEVSTVNAGDALLQVFLRNAASGVWIPETRPWELSGVEFRPEQLVSSAKLGLIDSKWTGADIGRTYLYELSGYVLHRKKAEVFFFEKSGVYPGDA